MVVVHGDHMSLSQRLVVFLSVLTELPHYLPHAGVTVSAVYMLPPLSTSLHYVPLIMGAHSTTPSTTPLVVPALVSVASTTPAQLTL